MKDNSSVLFQLKFYIISTKGAYQSTTLVKFDVSSRKSEILLFHGLLLYKSYKVSAKKVQKCYLSRHVKVMHSLKKNWLVVSNMTWGISWIFIQSLKSLKLSLRWAIFFPKYMRFELKNYKGVIFHGTERWCKIWINTDFVVSKMAWGILWNFHWSTQMSEKLNIDRLFLSKAYNDSATKF